MADRAPSKVTKYLDPRDHSAMLETTAKAVVENFKTGNEEPFMHSLETIRVFQGTLLKPLAKSPASKINS